MIIKSVELPNVKPIILKLEVVSFFLRFTRTLSLFRLILTVNLNLVRNILRFNQVNLFKYA